jgi:hypothetical protein
MSLYRRRDKTMDRCVLMLTLMLALAQLSRVGTAVAELEPQRIQTEEYPVLDVIVQAKFLTSATRLVKIERDTATRLHPEIAEPPTEQSFLEAGYFDGRLQRDLVREFVFKNQRPAQWDHLFNFGVPYRFVSSDGIDEPDAALSPRMVSRHVSVQEAGPLIDRLAFSRVAFTLRNDHALAYVANNRPDGTGAGFLVWLARRRDRWGIIETEVVWIARQTLPGGEQP